MNNLDVDKAIGYVNKIIDNVRCPTCDRLEGTRLRYSCGHTVCEECVIYAEECQICTPPTSRSDAAPKPDYHLTSTVKNASDLLKASQILFNINAFQHKRLSEQLRIEKELFPKCIQAPMKYENKRKSANLSVKNKENRYSHYFPGEAISRSEDNKMDNVQKWLRKNEIILARKPFADLNVNTHNVINSKNKYTRQNEGNENSPLVANRKRSHFKTTDRDFSHRVGSRKSVNGYKSPKKVKKENVSYLDNNSSNLQKDQNEESGIFMDNDPIIIDDSQESMIDKDKNAWLAVLKTCENEDLTPTSLVIPSQDNVANKNNDQFTNCDSILLKDSSVPRVPFFKKSAITETCQYCKNEESTSVKSVPDVSMTKPVKITIDNDSFLTTITVFTNVQSDKAKNTSCNVSVQTDNFKSDVDYGISVNNMNLIDFSNNRKSIERDLTKDEAECSIDKQSIDLFADDRQIFEDICPRPETSRCVVEESDSDTDLDISGPISVTAEVHRSCQDIEYGILNEVQNVREHESKPRRGPRGHTPTSTDSSEKENYNPNRIKRHIAGKKKYTKRK